MNAEPQMNEFVEADFKDFIENFENVGDSEKSLFNTMIEQEFNNLFKSVKNLKQSDYSLYGVNQQLEKNEGRWSWLALTPFIFWLFNANSLVFICCMTVAILMLMCILWFIGTYIKPRYTMLYRMKIKGNDFSLKNRFKLLYLLKMLTNNKYSGELDASKNLKILLRDFVDERDVTSYFEELFEGVLKNRDKQLEKEYWEGREYELQKNLTAQKKELGDGSGKTAQIEANLELLRYFTNNLENEKNQIMKQV